MTAALALVFLGTHLLSLPRSLEDIDSINFALGVESFDVAAHQPHPPGYPVFVTMGKVSTALVALVAPGLERHERAAVGLAVWSVAAGTLFAWVLVGFWTAMGWDRREAWWAAAVGLVSPLFWFTSARPLTDGVALVAAVAVQWRLLAALASAGRLPLVLPAFLTGLLIGVRTQTMWLTVPLLLYVAARRLKEIGWRSLTQPIASLALGCLVWAVPLVIGAGGLEAYLAALADQGREDFEDIAMLATSTTGDMLGAALRSTFIHPWRTAWLGQLMSALAIVGVARLLWSDRRALALIVIACGPYLAFHLAFHETETLRYALPVIVPVAGLSIRALFLLPARVATTLVVLIAAASLVTAQRSLSAYGEQVAPTVLAYQEAEALARQSSTSPFVVPQIGIRRVADWFRPEWPELPVTVPNEPAWLRIVDYFREGGREPAWYMTDRRSTDVVLFDPRSRRSVREYPQDPEVRRLVGRSRQDDVRWWEIVDPVWMLGRGWALSPEAGGVTFATGRDPRLVPAEAWVRRAGDSRRMLIGGWYMDGAGDAELVVEVDGRPLARWVVTADRPQFLRWFDLDAGVLAGDGAYARVRVRVEVADGPGPPPRIGLQQFDVASGRDVMMGFDEGWQQPETDVETGRSWRWAGPVAALIVSAGGGPVRLTLEGESSRRYFDRESVVVVSVEGQEVGRFETAEAFTRTIDIPAERLSVFPARVTIESDQFFVPAERGETPDRRQLAQRFFRVEASRAAEPGRD